MTKITTPVVRETVALYRGLPIVVELGRGSMVLRQKGRQERWNLDYEVALECAMKVDARERGVKV